MADKAKPWRDTPVEWTGWGRTNIKPAAACKHGDGPCDACGTANYADGRHTTTGGVGRVGALRRRRHGA